jgi:hypothetical protein
MTTKQAYFDDLMTAFLEKTGDDSEASGEEVKNILLQMHAILQDDDFDPAPESYQKLIENPMAAKTAVFSLVTIALMQTG